MLRPSHQLIWPLLWALALGYFWARGPSRALATGGNLDFEVVYNGLQTYQEGHNPYLTEDVLAVAEAHERHYFMRHYANARLLYAPGVLPLFGAITKVEYRTAEVIWLALQLAAFVGLLQTADALAGLGGKYWKVLLTAGLCFAPVHSNLAHGQPGIFFCLLTLVFFLCLKRRWEWLAALAFAALLGKPSFAAPAALVGLIRGGWRAVGVGCLLGALTWAPYLSRYGIQDGIRSYASAVAEVQAPGGDADNSRENPSRFDMLNLRSWLSSLEMPDTVGDGVYYLALIAAGVGLYRARPDADGLYWTFAAAFCTLALYHRFYDVSVLFVGVAATLKSWGERKSWGESRGRAWLLAGCLAPFAVPGAAGLAQALGDSTHPLVEALLIRHQTWALLLMAAAAYAWLAPRRTTAG